MLEMERIRVRILHENKPYDGVFNQADDMILLSLFMRVITGQTPSLPSGTFGSAGVKPDFYLINSSADSHWPLKKWSALPDCIRQVCVSRDKSASSTNQEPDREGDAQANGEATSAAAVTDSKPPVKIVEEEKVALLTEEQVPEPTKDDVVKEEEEPTADNAAEDESNEVTVEATVESKPEIATSEPAKVEPEPELEKEPVAQVEPELPEQPVVEQEVEQEKEKVQEPVLVVEQEPEQPAEPEPEPVEVEEPTKVETAAAPKPAPTPQAQNNKKKGGNKKKGKKKK